MRWRGGGWICEVDRYKSIALIFMGSVSIFLFVDIIDGRGLQIFLLHEDVSLQYYIPAVAR